MGTCRHEAAGGEEVRWTDERGDELPFTDAQKADARDLALLSLGKTQVVTTSRLPSFSDARTP